MDEFLVFFSNVLDVSKDMITLDTIQDDLVEWDSLMQIRIVAELEEKYNISINSEDISKYTSIKDFYELIKEL